MTKDINKRIKKLRQERGLKRKELVRKVNLGGNNAVGSLVILERIEEGRIEPNENQVWNLARFFDDYELLNMYFGGQPNMRKDVTKTYNIKDFDISRISKSHFVDKMRALWRKTDLLSKN